MVILVCLPESKATPKICRDMVQGPVENPCLGGKGDGGLKHIKRAHEFPMKNHGKIMGKSWENHQNHHFEWVNHGFPLENIGKSQF